MKHTLPLSLGLLSELNEMLYTGISAFETEVDQLFAGYPNSKHQLFSTDKGWSARVDLPGYAKEDISLQFEEQSLTLKAMNETRGLKTLKLALGDEVEISDISAKLEHGILEITLPRTETAEAESKSIEIK